MIKNIIKLIIILIISIILGNILYGVYREAKIMYMKPKVLNKI